MTKSRIDLSCVRPEADAQLEQLHRAFDRLPSGRLDLSKFPDETLLQLATAVRIAQGGQAPRRHPREAEALSCAIYAAFQLLSRHPSGRFAGEFDLSEEALFRTIQVLGWGLEHEVMHRITGVRFQGQDDRLMEALCQAVS